MIFAYNNFSRIEFFNAQIAYLLIFTIFQTVGIAMVMFASFKMSENRDQFFYCSDGANYLLNREEPLTLLWETGFLVMVMSSALMTERVLYNCLERGFYFDRKIIQVSGTMEELILKVEGKNAS